MNRQILTPDELTAALETLDGWTVETVSSPPAGGGVAAAAADGVVGVIKKHLKFQTFAESLAYVNQVAALAEAADHHPDITLGWAYATLTLTTHDRGGVTDVDIALAKQIDGI